MDNNNFTPGQPEGNQQPDYSQSVYSDYSQSVYSAPTPEERGVYQTQQPAQPQYEQPVYTQAPNTQYQGQYQQGQYQQVQYQQNPTVQYQQSPNVQYQQNYGQATAATGKPSIGLGIASMVLGIVSLVLFCAFCITWITAPLAIIFGILQLVKGKGAGKGFAIAGLITGGIAAVIAIFVFIGSYSDYSNSKRYGLYNYNRYDSFLEYYFDELLDL